jgi:hypothetical protein
MGGVGGVLGGVCRGVCGGRAEEGGVSWHMAYGNYKKEPFNVLSFKALNS